MSWSISFIGQATKVAEAVKNYSNNLSDNSKKEYDAILPAMLTLIEANSGPGAIVTVSGNGHASGDPENRISNCTLKVERIYTTLV